MLSSSLAGVLRHALTFGGGFLIQSGVLDASQLETATGAIIAIVGVVWSVVHKKKAAE